MAPVLKLRGVVKSLTVKGRKGRSNQKAKAILIPSGPGQCHHLLVGRQTVVGILTGERLGTLGVAGHRLREEVRPLLEGELLQVGDLVGGRTWTIGVHCHRPGVSPVALPKWTVVYVHGSILFQHPLPPSTPTGFHPWKPLGLSLRL